MALQQQTFGTRQAGRRLVLKNFKPPSIKEQELQDEEWTTLRDAVQAIYAKQAINQTLQSLTLLVERLHHKRQSPEVYKRLKTLMRDHLIGEQPRLRQAVAVDSHDVANLFRLTWEDHIQAMMMIQSIFVTLDRLYAQKTRGIDLLWLVGIQLFKEHILQEDKNLDRVTRAILDEIQKERTGQLANAQLRPLCQMLIATKLYRVLETGLLSATQSFYRHDGIERIARDPLDQYIVHVTSRLREEEERARFMLAVATRRPLLALIEQTLLLEPLDLVLGEGFFTLLEADDYKHLNMLFVLIERVERQTQFQSALSKYVELKGAEIVGNPDNDKEMVDNLLAFFDKMHRILAQACGNDADTDQAIEMSFERFINKRQNKPAEMVAKFMDAKLRAGYKDSTEEEFEASMNKVLHIFRFINGKDVFEAFYKSHLARRLLHDKSASTDLERAMLSKLKQECGASFTANLEGMFKDVTISQQLDAEFQNFRRDTVSDSPLELHVQVLTQSYWPAYAKLPLNLPQKMIQAQELFQQFYCQKHSSRQLSWQTSQGDCLVKAGFKKGNKELQLSLSQALMLLCFNDAAELSVKEIADLTNLEGKELHRTVLSMTLGKVRVLEKNTKTKEVAPEDRISINEKFSNQRKRIKINQIQLKETAEEQEATSKKVFKDRIYTIDAAIVRIMKTRKTLRHQLLMSGVLEQLKFPVKPVDIKKRIESLIDRDYLERSADDAGVYNYLA